MAKGIVAGTPRSLTEFLDIPAKPKLGRPPVAFRDTDLYPAILQEPQNAIERGERVEAMRKAHYLVPVDEHLEFLCFYADDTVSAAHDGFDTFNAINWS